MRGILIAVTATMLWSASATASEPTTGSEPNLANEEGETQVRTKIGLGGGYPEVISFSLAIGVPNRLEVELSGGAFISRATGALRVGYPWVIVGEKRPGWWVSLVPKAGLRYMWQEPWNPWGEGGCVDGGSITSKGNEVNAVGLNSALSFEAGYIFGKRFGLLLQLTAGVTWLFAGQNEHAVYGCDQATDEDIRTATDNSPWSPDLRASLVFTF